jgi:predicted metal-dependent TIM-barrel fold hydrolase
MPLVITPPRDLRVNMTYKMMRRLEHLDFPPERALFNYLDARLVENVHLEGFVAGITVDPTALPPRRAARLAADALEALGDDRRLVLSSGLRAGAADVLALPKTLDALTRLGVPDPTITRLAHTNARELYAR